LAEALAFETSGIKLFVPSGDSVSVSDLAASIEALTPAKILGLGASHISEIAASDASLTLTSAQAAAFEVAHIMLSAPSGDSIDVSDTASPSRAKKDRARGRAGPPRHPEAARGLVRSPA
jgi:hypothetical protein